HDLRSMRRAGGIFRDRRDDYPPDCRHPGLYQHRDYSLYYRGDHHSAQSGSILIHRQESNGHKVPGTWPYSKKRKEYGFFMGKQKKIDLNNLTPEEELKYEIAEELGLLDRVLENGWKSLSAKETGRVGGLMTKRRREKEALLAKNAKE